MRALRPARIVLRPARLYRGVKILVKCLQICANVFIDRPQNCAQISFRSCAGLWPNFGHSCSKLCPIMCRSRTKLSPNFGCSRARLCPISFAPCPFPNLAGTLWRQMCCIMKSSIIQNQHDGHWYQYSLVDYTYQMSVHTDSLKSPARSLKHIDAQLSVTEIR